MNIVSSQQDKMEMQLKQMGAEVQTIHGILSYVKIMIGTVEVFYAYNLNAKDKFFLQRITPYPLGAGVFSTQKQVLNYIKHDIEQFKNANNSKVFHKFIEVNYRTHRTSHELEDLFLNYNVPAEKMREIEGYLDHISNVIDELKQTSPQITLKERKKG